MDEGKMGLLKKTLGFCRSSLSIRSLIFGLCLLPTYTIAECIDNCNLRPKVSIFASKTEVLVGAEFLVDGSGSSDEDGSIVRFEWLVNGIKKYGPKQNISFFQEGDYKVVLTVTDNSGARTSVSKNIKVSKVILSSAIITDGEILVLETFEDIGSNANCSVDVIIICQIRRLSSGRYIVYAADLNIGRHKLNIVSGIESYTVEFDQVIKKTSNITEAQALQWIDSAGDSLPLNMVEQYNLAKYEFLNSFSDLSAVEKQIILNQLASHLFFPDQKQISNRLPYEVEEKALFDKLPFIFAFITTAIVVNEAIKNVEKLTDFLFKMKDLALKNPRVTIAITAVSIIALIKGYKLFVQNIEQAKGAKFIERTDKKRMVILSSGKGESKSFIAGYQNMHKDILSEKIPPKTRQLVQVTKASIELANELFSAGIVNIDSVPKSVSYEAIDRNYIKNIKINTPELNLYVGLNVDQSFLIKIWSVNSQSFLLTASYINPGYVSFPIVEQSYVEDSGIFGWANHTIGSNSGEFYCVGGGFNHIPDCDLDIDGTMYKLPLGFRITHFFSTPGWKFIKAKVVDIYGNIAFRNEWLLVGNSSDPIPGPAVEEGRILGKQHD